MTNKTDATTTVQELKDAVTKFRDERGWGKFHTPRNLATSIAVEAAELLEHFQWDEFKERDRQDITDELADVIHYCLEFAEAMSIDISSACSNKLERVKQKYPVEVFNPQNEYDDEAYRATRKAYRSGEKS